MKCTIPEISWHNRDPVLSVDIQAKLSENEDFQRLATGGTDTHVLIWHIQVQESGAAVIEFAADLTRHQRAVNVVRFSPSGEFLASGDDESAIIIWKQKTDADLPEFPGNNEAEGTKEQWLSVKVLRGHIDDIYDLAWSPDSRNLISGSVDNEAILWDVPKGSKIAPLSDHKGFVQGVAWDPKNQYVATMCSDRKCRVFSIQSKKVVSRMARSQLPVPENSALHGIQYHLYYDDTFKSFFRRLCFSPDGNLLLTPSGFIEEPNEKIAFNATYIYTRKNLSRPSVYLPSHNEFTIAVRCCPVLFELRASNDDKQPMFNLPYRMVIAVAEQKSVLLYDTQQSEPFAVISNIHYTRLTDVAWSADGRLLIVSSTDGYCSIITFSRNELGTVYTAKSEADAKPECTSPIGSAENGNKESISVPIADNKENVDAGIEKPAPSDAPLKDESEAGAVAKDEISSDGKIVRDVCLSPTETRRPVQQKKVAKSSKGSGHSSKKPVRRIQPTLVSDTLTCLANRTLLAKKSEASTKQKLLKSLGCKPLESPKEVAPKMSSPSKACKIEAKNEDSVETMEVTTCDKGNRTTLLPVHMSGTDTGSKVIKLAELGKRVTEPIVQSLAHNFEFASKVTDNSSSSSTTSSDDEMDVCASDTTESVKEKSSDDVKGSTIVAELTTSELEHVPMSPSLSGGVQQETVPMTPPSRKLRSPVSEPRGQSAKLTPSHLSPSKTSVKTPTPVTPKDERRTPRRVGLITLSSPKSKKNLLG